MKKIFFFSLLFIGLLVNGQNKPVYQLASVANVLPNDIAGMWRDTDGIYYQYRFSQLDSTPGKIINAQKINEDTVHFNNGFPDTSTTGGVLVISPSNNIAVSECQCILHVRDSISALQIDSANTKPDTIILAPGINNYIHVLSINYKYVYATSPYTLFTYAGLTEGDTTFIDNGGIGGYLVQTSANSFNYAAVTSAQLQSWVNQPIVFFARHSNPYGGGGYLIVYIDYINEKYW